MLPSERPQRPTMDGRTEVRWIRVDDRMREREAAAAASRLARLARSGATRERPRRRPRLVGATAIALTLARVLGR